MGSSTFFLILLLSTAVIQAGIALYFWYAAEQHFILRNSYGIIAATRCAGILHITSFTILFAVIIGSML